VEDCGFARDICGKRSARAAVDVYGSSINGHYKCMGCTSIMAWE